MKQVYNFDRAEIAKYYAMRIAIPVQIKYDQSIGSLSF